MTFKRQINLTLSKHELEILVGAVELMFDIENDTLHDETQLSPDDIRKMATFLDDTQIAAQLFQNRNKLNEKVDTILTLSRQLDELKKVLNTFN